MSAADDVARLGALADLVAVREAAEANVRGQVTWLRSHGVTWERIASGLGVTKQAAQQRYGRER